MEKTKKQTPICLTCQKPLTRDHYFRRGLIFGLMVAFAAWSIPLRVVADALSPVVISEIAAFEPSDHEWIEIVNRDTAPVDLTGWKFVEDSVNHGLKLFRGEDAALSPGEFAIIADVTENFIIDYPMYEGIIFDSSWSTLSEDGESVALKDANGAITESFVYLPAPSGSLERIDITRDDYGEENWRVRPGGAAPGEPYVAADGDLGETPGGAIAPSPTQDAPEDAPCVEPAAETAPVTKNAPPAAAMDAGVEPGGVVINEFLAAPTASEKEWIELWNKTDGLVDLEGWRLEDGKGMIRALATLIAPNGALKIELSTSKLNNAGDRIVLRDAAGEVINAVSYGDWDDGDRADNAPAGSKDQSVGRWPNAADTDQDGVDFAVLEAPTPGTENAPPQTLPVNEDVPAENAPAPSFAPVTSPMPKPQVVISELLPNPPGGDEREWIELHNTGDGAADLEGWELADSVSVYQFPKTTLEPGAFLLLPRAVTNIALGNDRDTVTLKDHNEKVASRISYQGGAAEGLNYARDKGGRWAWTTTPSPGGVNTITLPNRPPVPVVEAPTSIRLGELILLDATDTVDPDGEPLTLEWKIDEASVSTFPRALVPITKPGKHRVTLTARDARGAEAAKSITISVQNTSTLRVEDSEERTPARARMASATPASEPTPRQAKNQQLVIEGVVTTLPGHISRRAFLIQTLSGAREIYQHNAAFPSLALGDRISVAGRLSDREGLPRIIVREASDIRVLGSGDAIVPRAVMIRDITDEDIGKTVAISGTVVEISGESLALDDATGEIAVARPADGWPTNLVEGAELLTQGVLIRTPRGFKLIPGNETDLVVQSAPTKPTPPSASAREPPGTPLSGGLAAAGWMAATAGSMFLFRVVRVRRKTTKTSS